MGRTDRPQCDCGERIGEEVSSRKQFQKLKDFFSGQVSAGIFRDVPVKEPFYRWKNAKYYADKWYQCKECGCLWEFIYPEFPAKGRVRKFPDGRYITEDEELTRELAAKGKLRNESRKSGRDWAALGSVVFFLFLVGCLIFLQWRITTLEAECASLGAWSDRYREIWGTLHGRRGLYWYRDRAAVDVGIVSFVSICLGLERIKEWLHRELG